MKEFKKFTVSGQLVYGQGNAVINQKYSADFIIPSMSEGHARGLIQDRLISNHLRDTVEFYKRWRTCAVTDMQDATEKEIEEMYLDPSNAGKMSVNQLCKLAVNLGLSVDPSKIPSLEEARSTVIEELNAQGEQSNGANSEELENEESIEEIELEESEPVEEEFSAEPEKAFKKAARKPASKKKSNSGRK